MTKVEPRYKVIRHYHAHNSAWNVSGRMKSNLSQRFDVPQTEECNPTMCFETCNHYQMCLIFGALAKAKQRY